MKLTDFLLQMIFAAVLIVPVAQFYNGSHDSDVDPNNRFSAIAEEILQDIESDSLF